MSSFVNAKGLYLLLVRTSMHFLYCFTILFLVCLISSWWFFLYTPSMRSVENYYQSVDEMHQKTSMVKKTERELAALTQSISELKMSMQNYTSKQPRKDVMQQTLALVAETALQNGMKVNLCKLSEQINSATAKQILFAGRGSLDQLIVFFETLKNSKCMIDCCACEMTRVDNDTFAMQVVFDILCA